MAFQNPLYGSKFTANNSLRTVLPAFLSQDFNNAKYQGNNPYDYTYPYGYSNMGCGNYSSGYQQHYNQPYYAYKPYEFSTAVPNYWTAGVVPGGTTAMGFFSGNNMASFNSSSEYSHPSLSSQQQFLPVNTIVDVSTPIDFSSDREIPTIVGGGDIPTRILVPRIADDEHKLTVFGITEPLREERSSKEAELLKDESLLPSKLQLGSMKRQTEFSSLVSTPVVCAQKVFDKMPMDEVVLPFDKLASLSNDQLENEAVIEACVSIVQVRIEEAKENDDVVVEIKLSTIEAKVLELNPTRHEELETASTLHDSHSQGAHLDEGDKAKCVEEETTNVVDNKDSSLITHVPTTVAFTAVAEKSRYTMRNPIATLKKYLRENNLAEELELKVTDKKNGELVEEAIEFADATPVPARSQLLENVVADPRSFVIGPDRSYRSENSKFTGSEIGVDLGWDPEVAQVLRVSKGKERVRQEAASKRSTVEAAKQENGGKCTTSEDVAVAKNVNAATSEPKNMAIYPMEDDHSLLQYTLAKVAALCRIEIFDAVLKLLWKGMWRALLENIPEHEWGMGKIASTLVGDRQYIDDGKGISLERNKATQEGEQEGAKLLKPLRVQVLKANGVGEVLFAQLIREGQVGVCIIVDSYTNPFGAGSIIKGIQLNSVKAFEYYYMVEIESGLGLRKKNFIAFSLLVGNSHNLTGVVFEIKWLYSIMTNHNKISEKAGMVFCSMSKAILEFEEYQNDTLPIKFVPRVVGEGEYSLLLVELKEFYKLQLSRQFFIGRYGKDTVLCAIYIHENESIVPQWNYEVLLFKKAIEDMFRVALKSTILSDGSIVYMWSTKCPMHFSTPFRVNAIEPGPLDRTLIIALGKSLVKYREEYTIPPDDNQLHATMGVLLFHKGVDIKYYNVQNSHAGGGEEAINLNHVTKMNIDYWQLMMNQSTWNALEDDGVTLYDQMKYFVINVSSYFNIWAWESVVTDGENVEIHIQAPKDMSDTIRAVRHMKIDQKGILDQTVRVYASTGSVKARALLEHDLVVVGLQVAGAGRKWEVYLGLKQAIHDTFETSSKSRGINDHKAKDFFRKQLLVLLNYKDKIVGCLLSHRRKRLNRLISWVQEYIMLA